MVTYSLKNLISCIQNQIKQNGTGYTNNVNQNSTLWRQVRKNSLRFIQRSEAVSCGQIDMKTEMRKTVPDSGYL
jgi:hypothetical protein